MYGRTDGQRHTIIRPSNDGRIKMYVLCQLYFIFFTKDNIANKRLIFTNKTHMLNMIYQGGHQ